MRYRVVLSQPAQFDIAAQHDYLLIVAGSKVAIEQTEAIQAYCDGFDVHPRRGQARDDILTGLRVIGYRNRATLLFTVEDDRVTFLRVFYGGQDWPTRFR
jgi:toxin ParE1/3/4